MFDDIPPFLCEGGDEHDGDWSELLLMDDQDQVRGKPRKRPPAGGVILLETPLIDQIIKNLESIDTKLRLAMRLLKKGEEEKKAWHVDLMEQLRNYFLVLEKEKALTIAQNMYWRSKDVGTVVTMAWREAFGKSLPIKEQLMPFKCAKCKLSYPVVTKSWLDHHNRQMMEDYYRCPDCELGHKFEMQRLDRKRAIENFENKIRLEEWEADNNYN